MEYCFDQLSYAFGKPTASGCLKAKNSDFCVDEIMPIQTSGEGEHLWLKIEKDGANTDWVAQQLAKFVGVKSMAVSYAGMKDRHALTTQWFSLHLPGMDDPDFSTMEMEDFKILEQARHNRKLKRGALEGNRFRIRITELSGDIEQLEKTLVTISQQGVPNYFGEQRFGRDMGNIVKAEKLFNREIKKVKKLQRGLYISSARSWIFNQLLSLRIHNKNWLSSIKGDVYMLNGKSACFVDDDPEINSQRLIDKEINLTGCLWGEGETMVSADTFELEQSVALQFKTLAEGLESARLKQERRALRLIPNNFNWSIEGDVLSLDFELTSGAFATMVLREFVDVKK